MDMGHTTRTIWTATSQRSRSCLRIHLVRLTSLVCEAIRAIFLGHSLHLLHGLLCKRLTNRLGLLVSGASWPRQ